MEKKLLAELELATMVHIDFHQNTTIVTIHRITENAIDKEKMVHKFTIMPTVIKLESHRYSEYDADRRDYDRHRQWTPLEENSDRKTFKRITTGLMDWYSQKSNIPTRYLDKTVMWYA